MVLSLLPLTRKLLVDMPMLIRHDIEDVCADRSYFVVAFANDVVGQNLKQ